MVKVSVIIPVYNTQDYLKECLDSVLNQSLEDIEIICVDDGSKDNSQNILKSYQKKDSRINIICQENMGLGASRNEGLKVAQGEYVLFLDSDDYLDLNAIDCLYNFSKDKNLDILMFKITNFNNKTGKEFHTPYFDMDFLKEIVKDNIFVWSDVKDCIFDISVTSTSKLFKKELIENIQFPIGLIFEDNLFFIKTIFNAKRIYFADKYFYFRRIRSDSITNSYHDKFSDCIDIYELIIEFIKEIGKYDEFHTQIFDRQCFDFFHRFKQLDESYKNDFYNKLKTHFLNQQNTLESMNTLNHCSKRSLEIYNSVINSNSYKEFELSVNIFDLKLENKKYKKKNSKLSKQLDEMENSTSWKITKVFTTIMAKLNR